MGIASERIVTVPLAADPIFHVRPTQTPDAVAVLRRHRIAKPFVLFTSNGDFRKNIDGMVHAYSLLSPEIRTTHQLVMTQVGDCARQYKDIQRELSHATLAQSGLFAIGPPYL